MPDPEVLRKRFDFAMVKKLGVIKLPPPFWMQDPKINPRADHLFWAALLLKDPGRIGMAMSIVTEELQEKNYRKSLQKDDCITSEIRKMIEELLQQFSDPEVRKKFIQELRKVAPDLPVVAER